MNADELRDEMEGSARDIQAACTAVTITYHATQQPWMQRSTQATFAITIKPPTHHTVNTTTAQPTTHSPPLTVYAAAAMLHGYQRIHPAAVADGHAVVDERTVFVYDVDGTCYPTLNALLMRHSGQYRANKEEELTRKLHMLVTAHCDETWGGKWEKSGAGLAAAARSMPSDRTEGAHG